jgi:hypothetical protein
MIPGMGLGILLYGACTAVRVIEIAADIAVAPELSVALAVIVCVPVDAPDHV